MSERRFTGSSEHERGNEGEGSLPPPPMPFSRHERQIAPGVYFSPLPSAPSLSNTPNSPQLHRERDELVQSITHLIASNKEILAIDPDRQDSDLVQAVTENIAIIAKRQRRVNDISQKLSRLDNSCNSELLTTSTAQKEDSVSLNLDGGMYL